jgi:hypothetical protein
LPKPLDRQPCRSGGPRSESQRTAMMDRSEDGRRDNVRHGSDRPAHHCRAAARSRRAGSNICVSASAGEIAVLERDDATPLSDPTRLRSHWRRCYLAFWCPCIRVPITPLIMLLGCSPGATLSVIGSYPTSRRQRTPRKRRAHSSTPISPAHLPASRRQSDQVGRPNGSDPYRRPYAVSEEGNRR